MTVRELRRRLRAEGCAEIRQRGSHLVVGSGALSRNEVVVMTKPVYTAVFERGRDDFWEVELEEEPRVHTFGRSLIKARAHIREAAAVWFDVEEAAFDLVEEVRLPKAVKDRLAKALRERDRADAAKRSALSTTREAAEALVRTSHLSTRDAAELLGLSHQRVQQLLVG